ncbi:inositol polyphosphate 5-phosphatase K-like isoform X2 [Physella acuta]|uniref:inositol polyphosphate 5-phosphatase K-like isoform X2 n=1 Tax=Physella acuta TaxID=109671 RepID=UPI0027DB4415|nr:inositol polyphosphate 5-phosphatase K-like isoform X2 [Physella acuta]
MEYITHPASAAYSSITSAIYLVTWNVNGKPPPDNFTDLLQLKADPLPDLYAIGLQEAGSHNWDGALSSALKPHNYVKVKSRQLVGIFTIVYVKRSRLPWVTSVESELTKTGFGGYYGNKGASSIRLDILGTNLIVVNCHLPAHQENINDRLSNVEQILSSQKFKDQDSDNILDHDYVFWMGDTNFRVDNTPYKKAVELVKQRKYDELLQQDQLKAVMKSGLLFPDFKEGNIDFAPTYKFDPGTDTYDTSSKQRVPSYTDRILYFSHDTTYGDIKVQIEQLHYRSHPAYKQSDHKPVSSLFQFNALSKNYPNLITFVSQETTWNKKKDNIIRYSARKDFKILSGDWIGLYEETFQDFDSFVTYSWAGSRPQSDSSAPISVVFASSQLTTLPPKKYVLCYLTKKGSLCGVSQLITIA